MNSYHVLSDNSGIVLAVFNEELTDTVRKTVINLSRLNCFVVYNHIWSRVKPMVGDNYAIKGAF